MRAKVFYPGRPRFGRALHRILTWFGRLEFAGRFGVRVKHKFHLSNFDYSSRSVREGEFVSAVGRVKNIGPNQGSVYVIIKIYHPLKSGSLARILEEVHDIRSGDVVYDSDKFFRFDIRPMLELTEIPVSGEKDFCFTFRVPILPDWTEERRNYYTRVEIWKPARRSQSSCTISPRNCIFQLSKHTNISISRAKEASDPAASEAVPRSLRNPSIFLAYAREPGHVEWVNEQLAMMLERQGFVVWIDDRMLISGKIEQQVKNGIFKADIIVPVVTAKYRERWSQGLGGVGQEKPIILRRASEGCTIIPILLQDRYGIPEKIIELADHRSVTMDLQTWQGLPFGELCRLILNRAES